jgi:hypothetical protein
VSDSADDLKHDLECLRLASDLMQLFRTSPNAELQAHCVRMVAYWVSQVGQGPAASPASPDDLDM